MQNDSGREMDLIDSLTHCPCGSRRFLVKYASQATLSLNGGTPEAITYEVIREAEMFSQVSCAECGTWLDVDGSVEGEQAFSPGSFYAFYIARHRGDVVARVLPSVTVRTRRAPIRPVRRAQPE